MFSWAERTKLLSLLTTRAANSVDFYIEFKFEFKFSSFYKFEFNIFVFVSSSSSSVKIDQVFRVQKIK